MIKSLKYLVILVLAVTLTFGFAACGGSDSVDGDNSEVEENTAPPEPDTVEEALPEVDTSASVDVLVGNWVDISDSTYFANITKDGEVYKYEDNDGKYDATFKDGKLIVPVSDAENDFAEVYVDAGTGHLCVLYQGGIAEFEKK